MSTSPRDGYHHGDLRAALVAASVEMLEEGEGFSLRAVARRAGVSPAAPYRHFADREALESAVAVEGFRDLRVALERDAAAPDSAEDLAEIGVAYVMFALRRPAVFRLMFGNECDDSNDDRIAAAGELHTFLGAAVARVFGSADPEALSTALWSLAHGLAFLHLDGKLPALPSHTAASRVRASFLAVFALQARDEAS